MSRYFFTCIFILLMTFVIQAQQTGSIRGILTESTGEAAIGITLKLEGSELGAVTDIQGRFVIKEIPAGTYTISISGLGYENVRQTISVRAGETEVIEQQLKESTQELDALVVYGKSEATEIREQAHAVEVVNAKGFKNLSTNANDILSKISGVNIRQSGGLGSDFSVSLNGLSGNQVRFFLDGVPMDYFGTSLSLNNFSANLIERIEVYKGVVPIHLSSDALGGAINVITGQQTGSYVDASYSIGSFGTHITSLNGQYRDQKSGFTVRAKSFYNISDNNYRVPVNLVNYETGKEDDFPTWVRRFHDGYESKMGWVETGFVGTNFADQLMIGVLYSDNYKELQQPANAVGQAKIPYGEVFTEEQKWITNFSYRKSGLLADKLNVNAYFVGVFSESVSADTSSFRYDWFGGRELSPNTATGEIENRKTLLTLESQNYLGNINAEYQWLPNHSFATNYSLNQLELQGTDPFKAQNSTQFANPNTVTKQVFGTNYTQSFFDKKLKNTFFTKVYQYGIKTIETNYQGTEEIPFEETKSNLGYGFSSTYQLPRLQFKVSFERSTRFPEIIELFGDGLNFTPNPTLLPEESNNYNLGVIYNSRAANPIALSINGFVRDAEDFIIPQVQGIKVFHINNGKVLSRGIDLSASYSIQESFVFAVNGTYLSLRDNNPWRNGEVGVANSLFEVRLPNVPYLFGNTTLSYRKSQLFREGDSFSASVIQNYVHSFFYRWENLASQDKGTVPEQWTTSLDFIYSLQEERYNISFGIANLWDAEVYDNFQQLRPGRTFNFKIRYFIN